MPRHLGTIPGVAWFLLHEVSRPDARITPDHPVRGRTSPRDSLRLGREAHVGEARGLDLSDVQPPTQLPVREPSSVRPDEVQEREGFSRPGSKSDDFAYPQRMAAQGDD